MTTFPHVSARAIPLALLALALAATSGCGWLRGKNAFDQPPESRPLEIPPGLDSPRVDPAKNIPAAPAPRAAQAAPAAGGELQVTDSPANVWPRLGAELDRIDGVEVLDRAQLLSAYNVRYQGEEFLVRVTADASGSRISTTAADGRQASGPGASNLLGLLRQRI